MATNTHASPRRKPTDGPYIGKFMTQYPFVSIIAPCRNEEAFIENAVSSILENDYPPESMEVLVVDGMSNDGTRDIVRAMARRDNRIRLLDNPRKIVPSAMNIGISEARGRYIVRIDCHSHFAADYISKCVQISQRTGADNVGGYVQTLPASNTSVAKAIAAATSSRFGVGNSAFRTGGPEQEVDTVPFGTFRKELFQKAGMYDERLVRNQDIELNSRIRKTGGRIIISPEIKLSYFNRATYSGLWQQSFNNGLWNPYTIWLVGSGLSCRHFTPMFFVCGLAASAIASCLWRPFGWVLLTYSVIYLLPATYFALRIAATTKTSTILVFMSFLTLHIAYGIGALWGVLTIPFKWPRNKNRTIGKVLADRKM